MSDETVVARAAFFKLNADGGNAAKVLDVHFNPASLVFTLTNSLQQQGRTRRQYVSQSTAKLTMDLIFDTTNDGTDVRAHTTMLAKLMEPGTERAQGRRDVPEVVAFDWGTFRFKGMIESYRETIDFFAAEGVPLRATVSLGLTRQDHIFDSDASGSDATSAANEQAVVDTAGDDDVQRVAELGGNPAAWKDLASANGIEHPRLPGALSLIIGAAMGASGGGIGMNTAPNLAAAAGGAFAGLRAAAQVPALPAGLDASLLQQHSESLGMPADAAASFGLGGEAAASGAGSLNADVGVSASLRTVISFDE